MSSEEAVLSVLTEGEINGLRYVSLPEPGDDAFAMLSFRVGTADESAPVHGITHLVEHLVMRDTHDLHVKCNAEVSTTTTRFYAQGDAEQVAVFLQRIAASIADLPLRHLDAERDLIRVEESHGAVPLVSAVSHFGLQGYGLATITQQVQALDGQKLRNWATRHLVAENAVLSLRGMNAESLGLRLPAGSSVPEPAVVEDNRPAPVFYRQQRQGVMLSAIVPDSWSLQVLPLVLEHLLMKRLRHETSLVYSVQARLLNVSSGTSQLVISSDGVAGKEQQVTDTLLDELDRACVEVDEDLVRRMVGEVRRGSDDIRPSHLLYDRANELLLGQNPGSYRFISGLDTVDAASITVLMRQVMSRPVLAIAESVQLPAGWVDRSSLVYSKARIVGRQFVPGPMMDASQRVSISEQGLSLLEVDGSINTIEWSSVALTMRLSDGAWQISARRGGTLYIQPATWHEGAQLSAEIARYVPVDSVVDYAVESEDPAETSSGTAGVGRKIELGLMGALLAAALAVLGYAVIVPGQGVMVTVAVFLAFIGAMFGLDARLRRKRSGYVRQMGEVRQENLVANASTTKLMAMMVAAWVVPTVLIVAIFLAADRFFWPAALLYGFAFRATREWGKRD